MALLSGTGPRWRLPSWPASRPYTASVLASCRRERTKEPDLEGVNRVQGEPAFQECLVEFGAAGGQVGFRLLLVGCQHTRCKTFALWRGVLPPPFDPPGKPPLRQRLRLGSSLAPLVHRRAVAGCSPAAPRPPPVKAAGFAGEPCGVTGGRRGRRCHRCGAGPPGLRDGLRPSLRRGGALFPTQQGPGVRAA